MKKDIDIQTELNEISSILAGISRENVYSVPPEYFSHLSQRIQLRIHLEDPQLKHTSTGTSVPTEYFDTLSDSVLARIKEEEKTIAAPHTENAFTRKMPFKVPPGYFDTLSDDIQARIKKSEPGKVVSMQRASVWKLLVAAVLSGIILLTSVYLIKQSNAESDSLFAGSDAYSSPAAFEKGIASLQDEEIVQYLKSHGSSADNDVLIQYINPENLPEETDYLLDENTLTDFLNTLN